MNTYTNAIHPKKDGQRTARNNPFHNTALVAILLVLVMMVAIAAYIASRPAVAADSALAVTYSNALEMQYARPWLDAHNKPVIAYGNALELQYAQPWLDKANLPIVVTGKIPLNCSGSMEMLYACRYGYGLP